MALRQYRPDQFEEYIPQEKQASYQEYQERNTRKEQLKEVLFFINIAIFSILTVISAYIYLSLDIPAFFAFILATATGLLGLKLVQKGLKANYERLQQKKRGRR